MNTQPPSQAADRDESWNPVGRHRVLLEQPPFQKEMFENGLWGRYHWPAQWVSTGRSTALPHFFLARLRFKLERPQVVRAHVSADERYMLFVDGVLEGRGPERGDLGNWFFETYDLPLTAAEHTIVMLVWALGPFAPMAQISAGPGLVFAVEGPLGASLNSGRGAWETLTLDAWQVNHHPHISHDGYCGKRLHLDCSRLPTGWSIAKASGDWRPATPLGYAGCYPDERLTRRTLRPAMLPPMLSRQVRCGVCRFAAQFAGDPDRQPLDPAGHDRGLAAEVDALLRHRRPLEIGARQSVRLLVDLEDYYCLYPKLRVRGGRGASVRVGFAESLYTRPLESRDHDKGDRNAIDQKYFRGLFESFDLDGTDRELFTLWWQAGRYVQIELRTAAEPLFIESVTLEETRYPFGSLTVSPTGDPRLDEALRLSVRSLEVGVHETFTDSPYYEQLAYVGDVRLESLALYRLSDDDRPQRKAIELLDASRGPGGLTQSCYPSRTSLVIAPYALLWIGMVRDFLHYRKDRGFVAKRLPGVRAVIDAFVAHRQSDGLIRSPAGWNFFDWSKGFVNGEVWDERDGATHSLMQWQFTLGLRWAGELEREVGEPELAGRFERLGREVAACAHDAFWVEQESLWSDDLGHTRFSEHAQALAILGGFAPPEAVRRAALRLAGGSGPQTRAPATIYFVFYVIEALRATGHLDAIDSRLNVWRELSGTGLRCLPESPEPTRSDSHGWGAHLIHHLAVNDGRDRVTDRTAVDPV